MGPAFVIPIDRASLVTGRLYTKCGTLFLVVVLCGYFTRLSRGDMSATFLAGGIALMPRVRAPLTVLDRPVLAAFRTTRTTISAGGRNESVRVRGMFYRSRNGNTCTDYFNTQVPGDSVSMRVLWNARRKVMSFISFADRTVASSETPTSPGEHDWMPSGPFVMKAANERKTVHGLECQRVVLVAIPGEPPHTSHDESWVAFDWGLVLMDVSETGTEEQRWEITRVDKIEPEASRFEIPEGFAIKH